jgi:hypothetical protein
MPVSADDLRPLLPAARVALAAMINAGQGDAAALVAKCGFSWNLAYVLARALNGEGPSNESYLVNEGIPSGPARAIARACAEAAERRYAANVEAAQTRMAKHRADSGAQRGARPSYLGSERYWCPPS